MTLISSVGKIVNPSFANNVPGILKYGLGIIITLFLTFFIQHQVSAQSNYKKGWIVNQAGDTLTGKINDEEWIRNPISIQFKHDGSSRVQVFTPANSRAFSVSGELYISANVGIDQAPITANNRNVTIPGTIRKTVFLSVLVKGPYSLYYYNNERKHYYLGDESGIFELISHEYVLQGSLGYYVITSQEYQYKQQLAQYVKNCPNVDPSRVNFSTGSLSKFVRACDGIESPKTALYVKKTEHPTYSSRVFVGILHPTLKIKFGTEWINFNSSQNVTFGYTGIITMPRWQGRRAIFAGLQYYSFDVSSTGSYFKEGFVSNCNTSSGSLSCSITRNEETIKNMNVNLKYLKFTTGYRYSFITGKVGPFIEGGLSVAYQLYESAYGDHTKTVYAFSGNPNPTQTQFSLVTQTETRDEIISPGKILIGAMGGIGANYRGFELILRDELSSMTFSQGGTPINNLYLMAGYQFGF